MNNLYNILIVEDQTPPLDSISYAIKKSIFFDTSALPRIGDEDSDEIEKELKEKGIDFARCYNETERIIKDFPNHYDLVFLDHRMPYENCTNLEHDLEAFSDKIQNIGYGLIEKIRQYQPSAKIIGTSSLSKDKLKKFEEPDFYLDKTSVRKIDKTLTQILEEIKEKSPGKR